MTDLILFYVRTTGFGWMAETGSYFQVRGVTTTPLLLTRFPPTLL